jgi:hypothetical protein
MAIALVRVFNALNDNPFGTFIADGSNVTFVTVDGVDETMGTSRAREYAPLFESIFGYAPESPSDWLIASTLNIGLYNSATDPILQPAGVTVEDLVKKETASIKAYFAPKTFTDSEVQIGPTAVIYAIVDERSSEVVGLNLMMDMKNAGLSLYRVNGVWSDTSDVDLSDDDIEDNSYLVQVPEEYIAKYDSGDISESDLEQYSLTAAAAPSCPPATQDIVLNIKNRQNAIDNVGYGPMNPDLPSEEFWQAKADRWSVDQETAKQSLCGNCVMFIRTPSMLDCIASGITEGGSDVSGGWDTIDAAELGYCDALDFKCAASRTCDAWVVGGPITEEKK